MNQWFLSSTGSGDLAATIKGLLIALIPLLIIAGQHFHVAITEGQIMDIVAAVTGAISAAVTAFGLIRKLVLSFKNPNQN
jgi:hypothetical protein